MQSWDTQDVNSDMAAVDLCILCDATMSMYPFLRQGGSSVFISVGCFVDEICNQVVRLQVQ